MSDPRPRSLTPRPWPLVIATVSVFCLVLGVLAFRVRDGRDPAIGQPSAPASRPQPPGQVIVRRVERRVVVTRVRKIVEDPAPTVAVAAGPPQSTGGAVPVSAAAAPASTAAPAAAAPKAAAPQAAAPKAAAPPPAAAPPAPAPTPPPPPPAPVSRSS